MSNSSSGKRAKAISDRSGMAFPYSEMVFEWNGSLVHQSEFESKHPQLEPLTATADPEALYKPRPNNDEEEGEGFVVVVQSNNLKPDFLNPSTLPTNFTVSEMTGGVGEVTIVT